jgi:hypothetical protein
MIRAYALGDTYMIPPSVLSIVILIKTIDIK